MIPELQTRLMDDWELISHGERRPSALRFLVATGSIEGGASTVFVFRPKSSRPIAVVKAHRDADGERRVFGEAAVLQRLQAIPPSGVSVPRVLVAGEFGRVWALVQSWVPGRPLRARASRTGADGTLSAKLGAILSWIRGVHEATADTSIVAREALGQRRLDVLEEGLRSLSLSAKARLLLQRSAADHVASDPPSLVHGDLCAQNVLEKGSALAVVDWTEAELSGSGLNDVFSLVVAALQAGGSVERTEGSHAVAKGVLRTCTALGLSAEAANAAFITFLVERSLRHQRVLRRGLRRGGVSRSLLEVAARDDLSLSDALESNVWGRLLADVSGGTWPGAAAVSRC